MARRLTSLVLLLILAGGVLAGTPVFSGSSQKGMSAMECCRKQKMKPASVSAAELCCAVNCSNPVPNSPAGIFNFSASAFKVSDSILAQIASLLDSGRPTQSLRLYFEPDACKPVLQPKYIQHQSFLI